MFILSKIFDAGSWLGIVYTQCRSNFPSPNKADRFVHNDRDRKTELLSLSLQ